MDRNKMDSTAVFTVCNIAYLPRVLVLADSLMQHSNIKLKVYLFEKRQDFDYPTDAIDVIWVEDMGVPKLLEMAFIYDIIEFSTSLKPFIAKRLTEKFEFVIFLDPDTCLYYSIDPILEDLKSHTILLTPHYTTPQPSTPGESDLAMMRFGSFNLGFFAVRRDNESLGFLNWWSDRCIEHSFMESQFGLSTDQKWVAIAPCLFKDIHISFNLGYNAAPWNTFERTLTKDVEGHYRINGTYPLIFFHFSNFDVNDKQYLNKRASSEIGVRYPVLQEISDDYALKLKQKTELVSDIKYSFDYMSDGSYITPTLRRAYAAVRQELPVNHNPFDAKGPVGRFVERNYLFEKSGKKYVYPSLKEAEKNGKTLWVIYKVLRTILWAVGPNRFYDLSKLFVYLSMYRRNRELWKL